MATTAEFEQLVIDALFEAGMGKKKLNQLINGNLNDLSGLGTTNKTHLVGAINEVLALVQQAVTSAGAVIDDASTASTTKTYSVTKIRDLVSTAIAQLTAGAPAALDTIDELAAALGDDANFGASVLAALSNRVRFDAAQTLTAGQKAQALANIGAASAADVTYSGTNLAQVYRDATV